MGIGGRGIFAVPALIGCALSWVCPASAEEREFCAERPGQMTPPCTMARGRILVETAVASWGVENDGEQRAELLELGSTVVRAGITPRLELQFGWAPIGLRRTRDLATGASQGQTGSGDVTLGMKYGLAGPNGPVALMGFVSLPSGGEAIGGGDWGAGMRLPVQLALSEVIQASLTPEVDAAVNASGHGRHLAFGGAAGLSFQISEVVTLSPDIAIIRDDDPEGRSTSANGGLALAWQAGKNTQLDIGGTVGLTQTAPDGQVYVGFAHRF